MTTVKINYVDYHKDYDFRDDLIYRILSKRYNVEFSDNPDYVFYSCFGFEHLNVSDDCVVIFVTGEDECPNFNLCDYALGFEHLEYGDRYLRFPLYYFYKDDTIKMQNKHNLPEYFDLKREKPSFCSYVVSNANGSPMRDKMFELLSNYKKVDSGGKHLNNIGKPIVDKFEFDSKHKFSICFENTSHSGYTTEKLVQAFAARTIPIYWGDPDVGMIFNEKAFINVLSYDSLNEVVEVVKEIDENDEAYINMLKQPALLSQDCSEEMYLEKLEKFLYDIIDQPKEDAYRRSRIFHQVRYKYNRQFFYNRSKRIDKVLQTPIINVLHKLWMGGHR